MKQISLLWVLLLLALPASMRAQDAATEERLNKISGSLQDLQSSQDALNKRMSDLESELRSLRQQMDKPAPDYASQEDLKRVADAVKDVDHKRMQDNEKIQDTLKNLKQTIVSMPGPAPRRSSAEGKASSSEKAEKADKLSEDGYEYVVKKGDTLAAIIAAYQEQGVKVTRAQVLKANPKLKDGLKTGQKIFIPGSTTTTASK